jgi:putative restriction endonuclease
MSTSEIERWQLASRTWDELVRLARYRQTVEYGELGQTVGQNFALAVRHPLGMIYWYCDREGLPPLSVLAVSKETRLPGSGFGKVDRLDFARLCDEVFGFHWTSVPNPFGFATLNLHGRDLATHLLEASHDAEEVFALLPTRGSVQILFREVMMRAYRGRCASSRSTVRQGLEAAHIVPWSNARLHERFDVRNGVLLTAWHHRLFDAGLLALGEDHRIHVRPTLLASLSGVDRAALADLEGKPMQMPRESRHWPDPAFIRKRNEILGVEAWW